MKKFITSIALFLCVFVLTGQENVFMYSYRDVPADEMDLFRRNEAEFWSKVHSKLLKEKKITGWTMMSRVGGLASDPNIYFYIGIGSFENLENAPDNYNKAIEEVMGALDAEAQKKMKERLKQDKFTRADVMLNRQATVMQDMEWNYLVHNYAKANNVSAFLDAQDKYFKPFFEEQMKAGNTKQVGWITARVLNPVGNHYNWNCYTADAYNKISDVYNAWNTEDVAWPEEGMTEVQKTMVDPGFYKSVIWHKEMWLDADGNLRTAWD